MEFRLEFIKKYPKTGWSLYIATLSSPFIGMYFWGKAGMIICFLIGVFALLFGPFIYFKAFEIRRFNSITKKL